MTHQNLRLGKCWKLFWATLRQFWEYSTLGYCISCFPMGSRTPVKSEFCYYRLRLFYNELIKSPAENVRFPFALFLMAVGRVVGWKEKRLAFVLNKLKTCPKQFMVLRAEKPRLRGACQKLKEHATDRWTSDTFLFLICLISTECTDCLLDITMSSINIRSFSGQKCYCCPYLKI